MSCIRQQRVLAGLSGGVDSVVAAATLLEKGYKVGGLYIKNGFPVRGEEDAEAVASRLDIPLYKLDVSVEFRGEVVDYFVAEYLAGRTPNPCCVCNKRIKFRHLLDEAGKLGFDLVATGHYARESYDVSTGRYALCRGADALKDQSYFLFMLGQQELGRVLFPNGNRTKKEIRAKALELGFNDRPFKESQEICFIPDDNYKRFIRKVRPELQVVPGNFVDRHGKILGRHRGIHSYTVGQRRGLSIASAAPYYVLEIDVGKNEVILGRQDEQSSEGLVAAAVSWVSGEKIPEAGFMAVTKIRYRHGGVESKIMPLSSAGGAFPARAGTDDRSVIVRFSRPQKAVTPGQAAVFYRGDRVLGGGWIVRGF
ncbi:MAG TPA: tRNA 2-thiouridine(34) synthase MnmA [Syntrophales bacterium]|nr:tRNA 2-thiouridine(34) synthase MnmA [Syntrophales bacterium]HPI56982.1 tRNA 2-thiouridine(34) synthase MnmA [Syntrophales bacterium]HPN23888.1 tRNA 2-thiouridine(34) synthase MnmA [Syntrophales bacterium]